MLLTRLLAKQLRRLVKKTLGRQPGPATPVLRLETGAAGLRIRAQGVRHAVEYCAPGNYLAEELCLPQEVLEDVQGPTPEPVEVSSPRPGILAVRWTEKGSFKIKEYPLAQPPRPTQEFPGDPTSWTDQPPGLLSALRDAAAVTSDSSARYALNCLQLSGQGGRLAATDGQQLLLQSGLDWGFTEDLLVARTPLFGGLELSEGETLRIGKTDAQLVLNVGRWKFWLPLETDGRFPDCPRIVPAPEAIVTSWQLTPADVEFLLAEAGQLPRRDETAFVTIDLGTQTAVRAAGDGGVQSVELRLSNSPKTGQDLQVCCDRQYLLRALELGFSRFSFCGQEAAIMAQDSNRQYLWMACGADGLVLASDDGLRIESPLATAMTTPATPAPVATSIRAPRRTSAVTKRPRSAATPATATASGDSGPATPAGSEASPSPPPPVRRAAADSSSLDQVLVMREQLRKLLGVTTNLLRDLGAEQRQQRLMKSTLASIRQPQRVA